MVEAADHLKWYICIRTQNITSQKTATFSVWYKGWEGRNEGRKRRRRRRMRRDSSSSSSNKKKVCVLIDVAIPVDRNVMQKEAEKNLKYKSLSIDVQQMWNMQHMNIPVITGATGIVIKGLKKNLEAMPGKHLTDALQKTAVLGT